QRGVADRGRRQRDPYPRGGSRRRQAQGRHQQRFGDPVDPPGDWMGHQAADHMGRSQSNEHGTGARHVASVAGQRADRLRTPDQDRFQSVNPLPGSIPRLLPVNSAGSPTRMFSNSHWASAFDIPVQPWLTFARPKYAAFQGAAWKNSPDWVSRMAHFTASRS